MAGLDDTLDDAARPWVETEQRSLLADPIDWLHTLRFQDLPPAVVRMADRCLLDLIGVAAAGRATALAQIATGFAASQLGAVNGARMLFDGRRASPSGAAFAGANMIDSFDAHDGHALTKGHAGVAILPALLGVADSGVEIDGQELLVCLAIGYETSIRAGIALHASAADYHTSGAWNAIGCAAVAARLLRLDRRRTREALGIAEYHGPRSQMMRCIAHPTMVKDGSGWGALAGVSAAYLAAEGFTGAPAVLLEDPAQRDLWSDLGRRWRIQELYFKPWPVCRWAQPAMQAASQLLQRHRIDPAGIAHVTVRSFAEAAALVSVAPTTTEAAQYSLPFPLAALLVRGRVDAAAISGAGLADPAVLSLSGRMTLIADPDFSRRFPRERLAQVSLTLADGSTLKSEPTLARGDPAAPLPQAEIEAKFHTLAEALPPPRRRIILDAIATLADGEGVPALLDAVLAPLPEAGG